MQNASAEKWMERFYTYAIVYPDLYIVITLHHRLGSPVSFIATRGEKVAGTQERCS